MSFYTFKSLAPDQRVTQWCLSFLLSVFLPLGECSSWHPHTWAATWWRTISSTQLSEEAKRSIVIHFLVSDRIKKTYGYLGSLPLNRLLWIGVFRHADGCLLSGKGWVSKELSDLQALLHERPIVLISKLDRVLNRAEGCLLFSGHAVGKSSGKLSKKYVSGQFLNTSVGAHPPR